MKTVRVYAQGNNETELLADALRQAHGFFGLAVPLEILPSYEVLENTGASRENGLWSAHVWVTPAREPLAQSDLAEQARRQVQHAWKYIRETYGKAAG